MNNKLWNQLTSHLDLCRGGELEGMEFWVFGYRMFLDHLKQLFKE